MLIFYAKSESQCNKSNSPLFSIFVKTSKSTHFVFTNQQKHQPLCFFFGRRTVYVQFFIRIQTSTQKDDHAPRRRDVQF